MNNSRTVNSFRNIVTGFMGQFLQMFISFFNRIIFVHCLSEAYLGINGLFTNILSMLSLAELGISSAIAYALYKPLAEHNDSKIGSLMNFYAKAYRIIGLFVGVLGIIILPFLNFFISDSGNIRENLQIIYLLFLFNTVISYFYSYKTTLITADQKSYVISLISYFVLIIQTIIQIIVLLGTKNYLIYLIIQSIGTLITNILISIKANKMFPVLKQKGFEKLSREDKYSLFINIKALVIIKFSGVLVNSTDNIIISATKGLGLVSTGIASNYILLTSTLNSIVNHIFNGITASIGNLNAIEGKETKISLFKIINLMNFWLFSWCSISFIFLSSDIVSLLFGNKYVVTMPVVVVMSINFYTVGMQSAVWTYKNTLGLFNYGKYLILVTGIINIILSIWLGHIYGLFGIFLATFLSRLVTNLWYDPYAVFKYGLQTKFVNYLKKYLFYLIVACFQLLIMNFIFMYIYDSFTFKLIICIILPNSINYMIFKQTEEFNYLLTRSRFLYRKIIYRE